MIKVVMTEDNNAFIKFFIECQSPPQAIQISGEDPQLDILQKYIPSILSGFEEQKLITFIDLGAGLGRLLDLINCMKIARKILYIPWNEVSRTHIGW